MQNKREHVLTTITLAAYEAGGKPSQELLADIVKRLKAYGHFTTEDEFIGAARIAAHQAVAAQQETAESSVSTRLSSVPSQSHAASGSRDTAPGRLARPGKTLRVVKPS